MKKTILLLTTSAFLFGLNSCTVNQEEKTKLPEVDLNIEGGNLPEFNVNWADVNVKTETRTMEVPKVVVVMEEEEFEVPVIDVDIPNSGDKIRRNIQVEAQVKDEMHRLEIMRVNATNNNLVVISTLKETGQDLKDKTVRVSDVLELNAPEELNIKHYIVGKKPSGNYNNAYTYVNSMNDIPSKYRNGKTIWEK